MESVLENCGLMLPPKCVTPLSCGNCPEIDVTRELRLDGVQWHQ